MRMLLKPETRTDHRKSSVPSLLSGVLLAMMPCTPANAVELDITGSSIMDLMQMTVTSVTKTEQRLQESAAAVYVITGEDLRRMRVTNIPDALRLVPGLHVTQYNSSTWAVSIRGFGDVFANKLLVLMDGRTIYTPLFAGTFWEIREPMLEDIDRIEVIRGPGGTLWGANAVNGVINIITKHAEDTQGDLLALGVGEGEKAYGAVRFGRKPGDNNYLRTYAKFHERDSQHDPAHRIKNDWRSGRAGFRWDWDASNSDSYTLQGDIYEVETEQFSFLADIASKGTVANARYSGGNILGRFQSQLASGNGQSLQLYIDYQKNDFERIATEKRSIFDLEYQQNYVFQNHKVLWGIGYRLSDDELDETVALPIPFPFLYPTPKLLSFSPEDSKNEIFSAFIQDEIRISEDLKLTAGIKAEKNDFTGTELQPSLRVSYTPDQQNTLWGAVSRAVRTPSRFEADITNFDSPNLKAEELIAWEIGHRAFLGQSLRLDTALFLHDYDNLIYGKTTCVPFDPGSGNFCGATSSTPVGIRIDNVLTGYTGGIEFNANWKPTAKLRLEPSFTLLIVDMKAISGHPAARRNAENIEDADSRHRFSLRSGYELSNNVELDAIIRYADATHTGDIPSRTTFDLGVSWFPTDDLELSLMGRNLADSHDAEQPESSQLRLNSPTEVEQSVFGKVTWKF